VKTGLDEERTRHIKSALRKTWSTGWRNASGRVTCAHVRLTCLIIITYLLTYLRWSECGWGEGDDSQPRRSARYPLF